MNLERVFRDDRTRPDALDQLVLGDEFAGRLSQNLDDLESTPAHGHGRIKDAKFAATEVDLALVRGVNQSSVLRRQAQFPPLGPFHLFVRSASDVEIAIY